MPGTVMACSPDGLEVAVLQVTNDILPYSGWLQIVDSNSGKVVAELRNALTGQGAWVAFSRDGHALGFTNASADWISIVAVSTGKVVNVLPRPRYQVVPTPAWLPDGRLAVPDPAKQVVRAFAIDGTETSAAIPYAPDLAISSSGVILALDITSTRILVQSPGGKRGTLDLGVYAMGSSQVRWSPDGNAAVIRGIVPMAQGADTVQTAILVTIP